MDPQRCGIVAFCRYWGISFAALGVLGGLLRTHMLRLVGAKTIITTALNPSAALTALNPEP